MESIKKGTAPAATGTGSQENMKHYYVNIIPLK